MSAMEEQGAESAGDEIVVNRWRRYGKDYLYVSRPDGTKLGRFDLVTGNVAMEIAEDRSALDTAVRRWADESGVELPVTPVSEEEGDAPEPPPPPESEDVPPPPPPAPVLEEVSEVDEPVESATAESAWVDLAANRAGQAAREQAKAARDAAPVRMFLARALQVHTDERAWRVGADGEQEVAWRLRKLDEGWHLLHALPVGDKGSDIDHVAMGPGGVFTLNTKNHPGKKVWVAERSLMVGGHKTSYLRNSRFEAKRASEFLTAACGFEVPVEPVIVLLCQELTIKAAPDGVHVVSARRIRKWLSKRDHVWTAEQVAAIYEHARKDITWR